MIYADCVLLNGNVITIDSKRPRVEAIAIRDSRLLQVGTNEEVKEMIGQGTEVKDLGGMTVVPGFNDAHNHPLQFASAVKDIDLGEPSVRSISDILNLVGEQAKRPEMAGKERRMGFGQGGLRAPGASETLWSPLECGQQ